MRQVALPRRQVALRFLPHRSVAATAAGGAALASGDAALASGGAALASGATAPAAGGAAFPPSPQRCCPSGVAVLRFLPHRSAACTALAIKFCHGA